MERKYRWTDNVTKCRTFPIDLSCPTNIDVPLVDLGHQKNIGPLQAIHSNG